ncbi:hypothetical protein CIW83_09770 [Tissierella sp. P1]|uniref:helix-turn-helix domain-containing protein n=1 Tax=Tissierella sp. P1 TaxID=1280483 RepID=UPI000BA18684|nr:helix-turn-helix domain-containing protein [Tissierella sp. P1]OZV12373.1 hypothetical protein CIW83_09770 [Tissierella sp. P1]
MNTEEKLVKGLKLVVEAFAEMINEDKFNNRQTLISKNIPSETTNQSVLNKNKYLLTVNETAEKYGVGRGKLYELIRSEPDFPIIKIGNTNKINAPLFEEWLNKSTEEKREI